MAEDPYHAVKAEIQTSLQTASTLRASFLRIASTANVDSEELNWARNEVSKVQLSLTSLAKLHSSYWKLSVVAYCGLLFVLFMLGVVEGHTSRSRCRP